jgi:hypothetical protein
MLYLFLNERSSLNDPSDKKRHKMRKLILPIEDTRHKVAFELIKQTPQEEIVKVLTENSDIGVSAEYEWVRFRWPESESWVNSQRLTEQRIKGKKVICDILTYTCDNGVEKEFIFDISSFFGKENRKQEKYSGSEYLNVPAVTAKFNSLASQYEYNSEDSDVSEKEYIAHIEEYIKKDKLRHDEYLTKLKKFTDNYPEIPSFLIKYANELVVSINEHDTFQEAKIHLHQAKQLLKNNPYREIFIINYGHALLYFANYFHRKNPIAKSDMKKTIGMIYELWENNQMVYELLDIYSYGLDKLFMWCKPLKEKKRYMAIAKKLIKIFPSYVSVKNYTSMFFDLIENSNKESKEKHEAELKQFVARYPISLLSGPRIYDYISNKKKMFLDLIDLHNNQQLSSLLQDRIIDAFADFFQDGLNRDVLQSLPVEYVLKLANYGLSYNLNADCYAIISSYLSENHKNINMACEFAEALAWDIIAVSGHDFSQKFTVKAITYLCNEIKKLSDQYPDIPVIIEQYAESLINCHNTYISKKNKSECIKALTALAKKYPEDAIIKDIMENRIDIGANK